jgi:hypothetical protein
MTATEALDIAADIWSATEMRLTSRPWTFRLAQRMAAVRRILRRVQDAVFYGGVSPEWFRRRLRVAAGAMVRG